MDCSVLVSGALDSLTSSAEPVRIAVLVQSKDVEYGQILGGGFGETLGYVLAIQSLRTRQRANDEQKVFYQHYHY